MPLRSFFACDDEPVIFCHVYSCEHEDEMSAYDLYFRFELESPHSRSHWPLWREELDKQPTIAIAERIPPPRYSATVKSSLCHYCLHFPALRRNWFSQLHFHYSINRQRPLPKRNISPRVTWVLTCDLDFRTWPRQCQDEPCAKHLGKRSASSKVIVRTHRHTHRIDCLKPWFHVKIKLF